MTKTIYKLILLATIFTASCNEQIPTSKTPKKTNKSSKNESIDIDLAFPNAPNDITRTILKDSEGNLWMATWEGMIKYDGTAFENISNKVSQNRFFTVYESTPGQFWFGTIGGGLYFYDGITFKNYTTKDGLVDDQITNIYEDNKGQLWFGSLGGISVYDGKKFRNIGEKEGLPTLDVNDIIQDQDENYWMSTRGFTYKYDGNEFHKITRKDGSGFTNVRHLLHDRNGNIWLGGNDGLWSYDGNEFINFSENFTGYIYEDQRGNIWTSSEANTQSWELSKYDYETIQRKEKTHTKIKTSEPMFFGIEEDEDGNIWVGSLRGAHKYDGNKIELY